MAEIIQIPVALSNRHVHLSRPHVEALFGEEHKLTPKYDLSQPGQFACEECVEVVGPKGALKQVRVLGPERAESQAELSITDGYVLGVSLPVRQSGKIEGTPGGFLMGPKGAVKIEKGFICAARHIHFTPEDAKRGGIENGQVLCVRTVGARRVVFEEVIARVSPDFDTEMHLDIDEGNAAGLRNGDLVEVIHGLCDLCSLLECPLREDVSQTGSRPYCSFAETHRFG